ncbi:MAG: PmoA family protein, partial [Phycisphaerae bacterium]
AHTVTVSAGKFDRADTIVTFTLPPGLNPNAAYGLVREGDVIPVQLLSKESGAFVLKSLKAGESRTFSLEVVPFATRPPIPTDVTAREDDTNVTLKVGDKTVFRYNGKPTPLPNGYDASLKRGGYLFPVLTPSGRVVADDYPPMHKHHHGIWFAWTATQFEDRKPDFWNMGQKKGTVEFVKLVSQFSGPVAGGLRTTHRYVDLSAKDGPRPVLNETWDVTAWGVGQGDKPYFVFDFVATHTTATDQPLKLPKYHYGGIGFRGHRDWNAKRPDAYTALTSEGNDRKTANESTARWCHMGGKVEGESVGLAILDHPSNFRHPTPLRVHPSEPFMCVVPQVSGDFSIEPGKPYVAKYRIVVSDREADAKLLDRLWNDYGNPVEVTVK